MKNMSRERKRLIVKASLLVGLLFAAAGAATSIMALQSMSVRPATAAELQHQLSKPVDVVLEITAGGNSVFEGRLLESSGNADYRRTQKTLSFSVGATTKFIMGSRGDLRRGAVVDARGRVSDGSPTDVDRVVILTGYAHVS